jgi:hypothetical protein
MADPKEVFKYFKLSVKVEQEPAEEVREHIKNTVLGTPGKFRYRHTSLETKLPFLGSIFFLNLRKADKLLGCIAFSLRKMHFNGDLLDGWYVRYFSVHAPFRDKTFKRKRMKRAERKEKEKKPHGDSLLKNFVQPYFDEPYRYLSGMQGKDSKSIVYAYVERENLRSWNFTELIGFETVGKVCTTIYSRYNPKKHPKVRPIYDSEKEPHLDRIRQFYKDYSFYIDQNLFYKDYYMVYVENGEILAGCQANPELWDIVDYPRGISRLLVKYGSYLPVIRRFINPAYQKFLAVEGIWYKEGCEKYLYPIFSTALSMHNLHLAIIWLDSRSPMADIFKSLGRLGFIGKIVSTSLVDIRMKFNNYRQEEYKEYIEKPFYISCFDMT